MVNENSNNPKNLWCSINKILHRSQENPLPDHSSLIALANSFGEFFKSKIDKVRSTFHQSSDIADTLPVETPPTLNTLVEATEEEVSKIIRSTKTTSCSLDHFPTALVKTHLDILITPITQIINMSMKSGEVPQFFKVAHVKPLLKKPTLSRNDLKNYRPVSNLNFISKILEKVVANRINEHITRHNLANLNQSAYKRYHSTETALLKLVNDFLHNMDCRKVTALV